MDMRATKLALARKKLKDHQEKKSIIVPKDDECNNQEDCFNQSGEIENNDEHNSKLNEVNEHCHAPTSGLSNQSVNTENVVYQEDFIQSDVNVTEILISNKRSLENQISELQSKLSQLENNYTMTINNYNISCHKIHSLEGELAMCNEKNSRTTQELLSKESIINEFNHLKSQWNEEKSNLQEQLELTKNILTTKERENDSLHSQVYNLQNQLEVTQLQLQQLNNGLSSVDSSHKQTGVSVEQIEALRYKVSSLEQQLKASQQEREQITIHYEHYVNELNEQMKSVLKTSEELKQQNHHLSDREASLIDQISDMEISLQNMYRTREYEEKSKARVDQSEPELMQKYIRVQEQLRDLSVQFEEVQAQLADSNAKVHELSQKRESDNTHDTISAAKLSADIASDKIAVQRATEQNKKLKEDVQRLEDAFVKMSRDKLDLTEKVIAEKYLNKELTIKLAEIDEKAKNMAIKLKAKDEEMIRLQSSCRDMERIIEQASNIVETEHSVPEAIEDVANVTEAYSSDVMDHCHMETNGESCDGTHEHSPLMDSKYSIKKQDAMTKLQERFLKIMDEVANLSDEKHRLEHIIVQLQNETDTICEYVALYQQQRSLLKKRDEERNAHIKLFQQECDKLKSYIDELTRILTGFANDKELSSYFAMESKQTNLQQVMNLLSNVKNSSIIDFNQKDLDLKNFHPCSCCSGQLIDV